MLIQETAKRLSELYKRGFIDKIIPELKSMSPIEAAYISAYISNDLEDCGFLSPGTFITELFDVLKEEKE